MNLQNYITTLLIQHNCVIVPGFGGFVANYRPAVIETYRNKIHPPSKSILFNPHLVNNDGLLGNYVAQEKSLDYSEALLFISGEVKNWKKKMQVGDRIEIGEIGFLYLKDDQVQFEQSREVNLLLSSYGLRTVNFLDFKEKKSLKSIPQVAPHEIEKETTEPSLTKNVIPLVNKKEEVPILDTKEEPSIITLDTSESISPLVTHNNEVHTEVISIKKSRFGNVAKYAMAVCVVPLAFYSYWIPMETDALDTKSIQFSDFNPIHNQLKKVYKKRTDLKRENEIFRAENWNDLTENIHADIYNFELTEDFYVPIDLEKAIIEVDKTDVKDLFVEDKGVELQKGKYHIISGCFSVKNNAENLVLDLQSNGFSSSIFDKSAGLHRVSAGSFETKKDAEIALEKVEANGFSAWILVD